MDMEIEQEEGPRRDPTLTILFSLFLTVFAFFILLNAISVHHGERERTVAHSVSTTFAQPAPPPPVKAPVQPSDPSPAATVAAAGDVTGTGNSAAVASTKPPSSDDSDEPTPLGAGSGTADPDAGTALRAARLAGTGALDGAGLTQAVGRLFDPGLPVTRATTADRGRLMQITLPATDLFDAEGPDMKRSAIPLIDRIAVLIARRPTGVRYTVAFTASLANESDPAEQALAIRRGIALTDLWSRRGGPPDGLSIALRPGRKGEIRLTFDALGRGGEPAGAASGANGARR